MSKPFTWCCLLSFMCVWAADVPARSARLSSPDTLSAGISIDDFTGERSGDTGSDIGAYIEEEVLRGRLPHRIEIRSRISARLQTAKGYLDGTYLGSKLRTYHRLRLQPIPGVMGALLVSKDPGERSSFDCLSGHMTIRNDGIVRTVVAGDYAMAIGQGVVSWRPFGSLKGAASPAAVKRKGTGLAPVFVEGESQPYRGFAVEAGSDRCSVAMLSSWRAMSGSIDSTGVVTSIRTDGMFRTRSDEEKRNNFTERTIGMRFRGRLGAVQSVGLTMMRSDYSRHLLIDAGRRFAGDRISIVSFDWDMTWGMVDVFGEWAMAGIRGGGLGGILMRPDRSCSIVLVLRHYPLNYYRPHASPMAEQTSASNESGEYIGIRLHPLRGLTLSAYLDRFTFPEPAWSSQFPSHGTEFHVEAAASIIARLRMSVRYRQKQTTSRVEVAGQGGSGMRVDASEYRRNARIQMDCEVVRSVNGRLRGEWVVHSIPRIANRQCGFLLLQDLTVRHPDVLSWSLRAVYFRTQGYDARLYDVDNDLPGTFSFVPLYGRGIRWSVNASLDLGDMGGISMRYGETLRDDVRTIGSGSDQLPANFDNRFGVQVDLRL